jgi:NAD(P)-dependent dehydrogenase (short-subunit alcohol dehydrogenase family)
VVGRVAIVSGANRGIGLAIALSLAEAGYVTYGGARTVRDAASDVKPLALDVTDPHSVDAAIAHVLREHRRIDVLVNNAGAVYDVGRQPSSVSMTDAALAFDTNVLGAWRLANGVLPAMRARGFGRIVNVSSRAGSFQLTEGRAPAYSVSKAAVNMLTVLLASEVRGLDVLVNACCPGWVRTEMGGPNADKSPGDGADTPVWLATLPSGGPSGGFFADRLPIAW